jgi:UDP-N-acetylmuramate: L-alanyl-gamma-D-glutamyl-meso-diaminopimelate ligase
MRIHLIAIGGSAMHNLALALKENGHEVSGSDDHIYEPSYNRLAQAGLLPSQMGWQPEQLSNEIELIILGMHARPDNPELKRAKVLGIPIQSYPEYIFHHAKDKKRVVIAGSHGKTSITSMILHVLQAENMDFDFLVGAQLKGFKHMVRLSDAPLMIIEGDEYLSSPVDRKPKFLWYKPHTAVISGIAWDHINVFPTLEEYENQFSRFMESIEPGGKLIYCETDETLSELVSHHPHLINVPYKASRHHIESGQTFIELDHQKIPLQIFGNHNLQNLEAARLVCEDLGIEKATFYKHIQEFQGANKRMELIRETSDSKVFKDFAHSPSKLKATTEAVVRQFPDKRIVACIELHTFSSLTKNFLKEYAGTVAKVARAMVYYNPKIVEDKKLEAFTSKDLQEAFKPSEVEVFSDSEKLIKELKRESREHTIYLLMTSGNFDGVDLDELSQTLI